MHETTIFTHKSNSPASLWSYYILIIFKFSTTLCKSSLKLLLKVNFLMSCETKIFHSFGNYKLKTFSKANVSEDS